MIKTTMDKNKNTGRGTSPDRIDNEKLENISSVNDDLKDSKRDEERLQPDQATLDLPEARDIPGQEHIHVPPLGEVADTTISSADEEADKLLPPEND
ncbi:MAG TPA: hypothetical protein VK666_10960 [Chryseolinea sp.]|nr:hypothetical protein [Chryseolinea sp.]